MTALTIALDAAIVLGLIRAYMREYSRGLRCALLLLIIVPQSMGLLIGPLPVLTTHRVIIAVALMAWVRGGFWRSARIPLKRLLIVVALANFASLLAAEYLDAAIKRTIGFLAEELLFYSIMVTSLDRRDRWAATVGTIYVAVVLVVALGLFERVTGLRPLLILPSFGEMLLAKGIQSTLPHPIFLGLLAAVGMILSIQRLDAAGTAGSGRLTTWGILFVCGAVLYFSVRRGPWLAAIIALLVILLVAPSKGKVRSLVPFIILAAVMVIRPGVYETISGLASATFDPTNPEGASYYYRWELWHEALARIRVSNLRTLLGYGLEYHRYADMRGEYFLIPLRRSEFSSWDNGYATMLLEGGVVGLAAHAAFYLGLLGITFRNLRRCAASDRAVFVGMMATTVMFLFMMHNVQMFSVQANFVFYTLAAVGVTCPPSCRDSAIAAHESSLQRQGAVPPLERNE